MFGRGAVTTCFNDIGLSWLGFGHPTFRLRGECSNSLRHRRGCLIETVLSDLQWQVCHIYLDDLIVYGKTFEEMLHNLELVFDKLTVAALKLEARKLTLFAKQVQYLWHVISYLKQGLRRIQKRSKPLTVNKTPIIQI